MHRFALLASASLLIALSASSAVQAKGCMKGAAVGAVAGHFVGKGHAKAGAAAGCVGGHHLAHRHAKGR